MTRLVVVDVVLLAVGVGYLIRLSRANNGSPIDVLRGPGNAGSPSRAAIAAVAIITGGLTGLTDGYGLRVGLVTMLVFSATIVAGRVAVFTVHNRTLDRQATGAR